MPWARPPSERITSWAYRLDVADNAAVVADAQLTAFSWQLLAEVLGDPDVRANTKAYFEA